MKASVILPCYNGEETIAQQMDSLVRQNWQDDWEFILADNGSTDRTVEIVQAYADRIPNLKIFNVYSGTGLRKSVAASYYKAFREAKGDVFITCESDDEAADGWLEGMVQALESGDHYVCSALDHNKLNDSELVTGNTGIQDPKGKGLPNFVGPMKLPFAFGCSIGVSRHLWETIGDPDPNLATTWDTDYCWRAQLAGFDLKFLPDVIMHYRHRGAMKSRFRQAKNYGRGTAQLTAKYGVRSRLRYLAYNIYHLFVGLFLLAISIFPGTRSAKFRIWQVANAIGQLQGFGDIIKGRHPTMPVPDRLKPLQP